MTENPTTTSDGTWTVKVGDKVVVNNGTKVNKFPGVWTVTKVNPKNVTLDQNGMTLSCYKGFLSKATEVTEAAFAAAMPFQAPGAFVQYAGTNSKFTKGQVFVVLADKGDKVNVTLPGGNGGVYWKMPRANLSAATVTVTVN